MQTLRILHLEDDPLDADLVHREVSGLGMEPVWLNVATGEEFHAALERERFDAIVSDGRVPGITGVEALEHAKARRPGVPFMFVSGNSDPRWVEHCISVGATDYVPKDQLWRLPSALKRLGAAREAERLAWLTRARAALIDSVRQLSLARSVDDIAKVVRSAARELLGADGATFVLREGDACHYADEDAIAPLWKGSRFPMSACISGWVMLQGQPAVVPDIELDPRIPLDAYRPTFVKSLVMVPIRAQAPLGAIGCYWAREHHPSADEIETICALADATALAFENVALVQTLEQRVAQRTAALEAANRDLEAFTYSVSHDLRAPLRAIRGFGDLLAAAKPAPEGDGLVYLQQMRGAAHRMEALIENMLSLSKVTRAELRHRRVPIGAIARDVVNRLAQAAPSRQVEVEIDETLMADGDAGLLSLALENLLSNAWKFSSKTAQARLSFSMETMDDGRKVYCVRDNGAGFDMRHAPSLFEPFQRLHRESEFAGTGVGLAIVQRVIEKHGGSIWARSEKGQGASFCFELPAAGEEQAALARGPQRVAVCPL